MIVQPVVPAIVLPDAIVIVVVVLVTPMHVPPVAPMIVTPAGIVSVNGAVSVSGVVFGLPSVSVSVAVPPDVIVAGAIAFASVGAAAFTVSGALAGRRACPPPSTTVLVVFVTVPGVDDVIVAVIVHRSYRRSCYPTPS